MKILYYYPEQNDFMLKWQKFHFFDELSYHGIEFEVINPLDYNNFDQSNEAIVTKLKKGRYDLFFSCLCYEELIYPETLKEIKAIGVPSLCFRPDNLSIPMRDKSIAPLYDLVWLTAKETQYLYDKWGAKTIFAPYAANPFAYKFNPRELVRRVCFIGVPHGSRSVILNTLISNDVPLDIYCKKTNKSINHNVDEIKTVNYQQEGFLKANINRLRFKEGRKILLGRIVQKFIKEQPLESNEHTRVLPRLSFEEMIQNYSNYSLSLSFTSFGSTGVLKNPLNIMNLRNFEIPMCGGIQLCKYSDESSNYFEDGKEIVMYSNEEEMIEKAFFYSEKISDSELMKMKIAARKRAETDHTWINRFNKAFSILGI